MDKWNNIVIICIREDNMLEKIYNFTQKDKEDVESMSACGMSIKDIAIIKNIPISVLKQNFINDIKRGRAIGKYKVMLASYIAATEDRNPTMLMFLCKAKYDVNDEVKKVKDKSVNLEKFKFSIDANESSKMYTELIKGK
jgi:hypothetical protein